MESALLGFLQLMSNHAFLYEALSQNRWVVWVHFHEGVNSRDIVSWTTDYRRHQIIPLKKWSCIFSTTLYLHASLCDQPFLHCNFWLLTFSFTINTCLTLIINVCFFQNNNNMSYGLASLAWSDLCFTMVCESSDCAEWLEWILYRCIPCTICNSLLS